MMTATSIDVTELKAKVKQMYRAVAQHPDGRYHFEMGLALAQRLGYPTDVLDRIPAGAVESFAGVGYVFDLAELRTGERVLDLGSGSGMDAFVAAELVGRPGRVIGVDMTLEQLNKAEWLRAAAGLDHVTFIEGHIEDLPVDDASIDVVISNGVINLSADKPRVFAEAARVLRPGGRVVVADIVTEAELSPSIVCNTDLWASCIGGAAQRDAYQEAIEAAGFHVELMRKNPYEFLSGSARGASATYGVMSISVMAGKVV
jgi:ubiquinone/menaquinone biosynthesis C-methylase UbiE